MAMKEFVSLFDASMVVTEAAGGVPSSFTAAAMALQRKVAGLVREAGELLLLLLFSRLCLFQRLFVLEGACHA